MSAPLLWIFIPLVVAGVTLLIENDRFNAILGGSVAVALSLIALLVPIDQALGAGATSFKIAASFEILGRALVLGSADASLLTIFYGLAALWFFGAEAAGVARRLVPLGMGIVALLVASIAVEPFLFAATFIEIAVLLTIPLLSPPGQPPQRGILRFLVYQTLAMPFILFAGWMLAGVEASPGDLALTLQSATMLGMGFAFLLAIFPLYSWMPLLAEVSSPFVMGFLLWVLPTITIIFGLGFLDRYTWLRTSPNMAAAMQIAGVLMVVTGGIWSAFQRHLGRMMAYAAVVETGYVIMAFGIQPALNATQVIFLHIIPRGVGLAVWALSLSVIDRNASSLEFGDVKGLLRAYPLAGLGIFLAQLSTAGFPLLAGFPARLALWEGLSMQSLGLAFWLLLGILGVFFGAVRSMGVLATAPEETTWTWNESMTENILLGCGMAMLLVLGIFPQITYRFLADLPLMFTHLSQ